jgi:inorganic pyrophosphatase
MVIQLPFRLEFWPNQAHFAPFIQEISDMSLHQVRTGTDVPDDVNVIIEIPLDSEPVKYEVDKETGAIFVDRMLKTAMRYPCNYGYIPHTLCGDGDPVDVLVIMPLPLIPGSVVRCRPIGMLKMTDEAGEDDKIVAVPIEKITGLYRDISDVRDLPELIRDQIAHFFDHYKDLERGKWVKIDGWRDAQASKDEILASIKRFKDSPETLNF